MVQGCPEAMVAMPTGDVRLFLSTYNTIYSLEEQVQVKGACNASKIPSVALSWSASPWVGFVAPNSRLRYSY